VVMGGDLLWRWFMIHDSGNGRGWKLPCLCLFSFPYFHERHELMVLHAHIRARRIRFHDAERDTMVTNTGMLITLHSLGTRALR